MLSRQKRSALGAIAVALLLLATSATCAGYSVLTHEQIVDMAWKDQILPLLFQRFPNATQEELRVAHAHAYGGCLIQDMGYYPFGNKLFSDLVHYVRSGDFVMNLLREAHDLNEYAFALGALAHYVADTNGHPFINQSVAAQFPKLRAKYGPNVTYEDDPKSHFRTEFGFDVVQVAKNRYTSDAYHDLVGFEVAKPLLERAFRNTYGIDINAIFNDLSRTIGSIRWANSGVIPEMNKVALVAKEKEFVREEPTFSRKKFLFYLRRSEYEKNWGKNYHRPGFGTRVLALILRIVPKIGPFKALAFKYPTSGAEDMYLKSVANSIEGYDSLLGQLRAGTRLQLPNRDFDTGKPTLPGEYRLTDRAYATLLHKLAERNFSMLTPDLRDNILHFYSDPNAPLDTKKDRDKWREALANLDRLKAAPLPASQQSIVVEPERDR